MNSVRISNKLMNAERITQIVTFPRFLLIMILIGIVMRFVTLLVEIPKFDGAFYSTIGYNVATRHDFVALDGSQTYSYSLTYPSYLASFYAIFGFSIPVTQLASIIVSIAVLGVAYILTANIMGKEKALIVTAVLALLQPLITATGRNYLENMMLLFFIPAIWGILKSFKDSRYIILASFFAGLVYYTKTDIGLPVVIGGMAAYGIWRFYHMRWALFKDKNYYIAFIILLFMVLLRFYLIYTADAGVPTVSKKPLLLFSSFEGVLKFAVQSLFHALLIGSFLVFWAPEFRRSIFDIKKEKGVLLLLSFALMIPIIIHACGRPLFSTVPIERVSRAYITIIFVPLLWLFLSDKTNGEVSLKNKNLIAFVRNMAVSVMRDKKKLLLFCTGLFLAGITVLIDDYLPLLYLFGAFALITGPYRKRIVLLLIAFLILSANSLTGQYRPAYIDVADEINKRVESGDVIALAKVGGGYRLPADRIYPYIEVRDVSFELYNYSNNTTPRFIISASNKTFVGYELVGIYYEKIEPSILKRIGMFLLGIDNSAQQPHIYLWERV